VTMDSCTFDGNTGNSGGAIHNYAQANSTLTVTNTSFVNNAATLSGGALRNYCELNTGSGTVTLQGCTFTENLSAGLGGAVSNVGLKGGVAQMTVSGCRFEGNGAGTHGGAIYTNAATRSVAYPNTQAFTTVTNCVFFANTSTNRGGALYNDAMTGAPVSLAVNLSTFANNTAQVGGAYCGTSAVAPASAALSVLNSIFWNNTTVDTSSRTFHGLTATSTVTVTSSSLQDAAFANNEKGLGGFTNVGGNIGGDPLFVNLALGDLHLYPYSPCVDAGASVLVLTDIEGNARPQGAGFDMGAYESAGFRPMARQPQTATAALTASVYPNPTTGAFTIALDREVTGYAQVFDLQGRMVASEQLNGANQANFDLGAQSQGVYLVRIVGGDEIVTKQIVVNKP